MLIPSSCPAAFTIGPPEEPGSSGAVCSTLPVMRRPRGPRNARSTPDTNPNVTRSPRPPGLDSANTGPPANVTVTSSPRTLCALVSTRPSPSTMPEPAPQRCPMPTTDEPAPSASRAMFS